MTRQIPEASLADVNKILSRNIGLNLNCHRVGIIQSFDSQNMTATVKVVDRAVKETYVGRGFWDYPLLVDCPVIMPIKNNKGITYPISSGDECLILFNDRDLDNWFESGNVNEARTSRIHSLSDGMVIVGLHSIANPVSDFNNGAVEMRYIDSIVSIDDKIKIQNAAQNLLEVLDSLITSIINLQVVSGAVNLPVTPATVTQLQAVSTNLNALLK